VHFALVNNLGINNWRRIRAKCGGGRKEGAGWHGISSMGCMKSKGFPMGPQNETDESEARRSTVLEFADLHDPEARKRILDRANQALKDARALIERLNAMDAKKAGHHPRSEKPSKD